MKIFKYLFIGLAVIIVLALAITGIFLATFDANQYKQQLSELVKQQTGRDLEFQGDIGLTFYPSLGMNLGSMSFSNASGFAPQSMVSVQQASVSVGVLSILSMNPEIAQLKLDGLTVNLAKNTAGVSNWDDLVKSEEGASGGESMPQTSDSAPRSQDMTLAGAFGGLNINNLELNWDDQAAGQQFTVLIESLKTGRISVDEPFPLEMVMQAQSAGQLSVSSQINTEVTFNPDRLSLNGLILKATASGTLIPVDQTNLSLSGDIDFAMAGQQLSVKGFTTEISTQGGVLEQSSSRIGGEIGFDLVRSELTIAVLDVQAQLKGESVPNQSLDVAFSAPELRLLLNQRQVSLKDINLALNENRFEGFVQIDDYAQPALSFALNSQRLDVDGLLGSQTGDTGLTEPETTQSEPAEDVQISLPKELLRSLQIDGRLNIGTLIAQGLTLNDVVLQVSANEGLINLDPIQVNLYEGSYAGSLQLDAREDEPVYRVKQNLSGFQIGSFLSDFMGNDPLSGKADLAIDLSTRGEWLSQLKGALDGSVSTSISDGALKGFNLRHELETAKARFKGEGAPDKVQKVTDFSALSLSALINKGVVTTDDLDLQAPLIRVGGLGSINLLQETVDYLVDAKLVGTTKGQQGGVADDISGLAIPVAITGPWSSPKIDVQYDEMMKAKLDAEKTRLSNEVSEKKAALQQRLAEEKARLEESRRRELEAQKAMEEARYREKLEAEKRRKQAELDAKKEAEKEKAEKKLEEKLKNLR